MKCGAGDREGRGRGRKPPDCSCRIAQPRTESMISGARMPELELQLGCSLCDLGRVNLAALPFPYL